MKSIKPILVLIILGALAIAIYSSFEYLKGEKIWIPTIEEPQPKLIFYAKWGFMGIGLQREDQNDPASFNKGFTSFYIQGNMVYIADTVKNEISIFENKKLIRSYQYPSEIVQDLGLTVINDFAYIFDIRGYLSKVDLTNGDVKARKLALFRKDDPVLTFNKYTLYNSGNVIVLNDSLYMNICFETGDLVEVPCPFTSRKDLKCRVHFIYLDDGHYAGIIDNEEVWLFNSKNERIGRVTGIDGDKLLYDMRRSYQVNLDGVYYVQHSDSGVNIFFKPWQKGHEMR